MKSRFIPVIIAATILFCLAAAVDISPFLRGPSYYPPEWRWEYLFQNTLGRVYVPLGIIGLIVFLFFKSEKKKKLSENAITLLLVSTVVLFFLLQFGVLFFSRSGIGVLVHRIINPEINGYFTAALTIDSVADFLHHYKTVMLTFVYHAKAHPPGAILLFYYLHQLTAMVPAIVDWAAQQTPDRSDVRAMWTILSDTAKATVFVSAIVIPLLSALSVIPLYFAARLLYGSKAALRSVFLFLLIPSLLFFIPINDAFLHIFSISAFCFFIYGLRNNTLWQLITAGVIMCLGILFNLSLLPVLVLFFLYFLLYEAGNIKKHFWAVFKRGLLFASGLIVPFLLLFLFFGFNFVEVTLTIMQYVPDIHTRSYLIWIFYNLYDFFIFTGIPVAGIYFTYFAATVRQLVLRNWKQIDPLFAAFTLMLLIVNFSGSIRGETARIWIPYIPFVVLLAAGFATKYLKLSTKSFAMLLLLQAIQILMMQEFWVMLW